MRRLLALSVLSALAFSTAPALADDIEVTIEAYDGTTLLSTTEAEGPDGMTVETAMQRGGLQYTATWFPSVGGYALMILDGVPATTDGGFGTDYWALCIDGTQANEGMSDQTLQDDDTVQWVYSSTGDCPTGA